MPLHPDAEKVLRGIDGMKPFADMSIDEMRTINSATVVASNEEVRVDRGARIRLSLCYSFLEQIGDAVSLTTISLDVCSRVLIGRS